MAQPAFKFLYLEGELLVPRADEVLSHWDLIDELELEERAAIGHESRWGGGNLYHAEVAALRVLYFDHLDHDEALREEIEGALREWADENGLTILGEWEGST